MSKRGENIYKRKDGRWEGRYVIDKETVTGRSRFRSVYGKTYNEVKRKLYEKRIEEDNKPRHKNLTIAEGCDRWIQQKKTAVKVSTYQRYHTIIEKHLKPDWGTHLPQEITDEEFARYAQRLIEQGLTTGTSRNILSVLRMVLEEMLPNRSGGMLSIKSVFPKERKEKPRVLTASEYECLVSFLLEAMDGVQLGLLLALECGLRIGEICALRWNNVRIDEGIIHIGSTLQRLASLEENGIQKTRLVEGTPKSLSSIRDIPLTGELFAICTRLYPEDASTFILTGTQKPMEPRLLQYRLEKICRDHNLVNVHFHTLRHTFATRCARSGVELKSLSEILGHATTRITLDRYVHPSLEMKRSNLEKLTLANY